MESFEPGPLVETIHSLTCTVSLPTDDAAPLRGDLRRVILRDFERLLPVCERLSLLVPSQYCRDGIATLSKGGGPGETGAIARLAAMICNTIQIEMHAKKYFSINPEEVRLYDPPNPLFGTDFQTKFPSASFELDEAGKCLALARYTAAVFHMMRIMEIGIRAVGRCLNIPDPVKDAERNWGAVLRKIKDEIDRRTAAKPQTWLHNDDKNFFSEIYVSLDAVRVAWRNTTMHVENKYTGEEAEHIFVSVRGFMKKLAMRFDEAGQPQA